MSVQYGTYAVPRMDLGEAFSEYDAQETRFVGPQVLPIFATPKKAGTFSKITRESLLKRANAVRAGNAAYSRIDIGAEDQAFSCIEYGLEGALGDSDRANYASDFDAEEATVKHVWLKLMIEHEIRAQALTFNTSTWTGASLYTDVSSAPWDAIGSDAVGHVLAAKEKVRLNTGMNPNALIVGAATLANLLANTAIRNQFPGASMVTLSMIRGALPAIFGLQKLIVGAQVYDSAKEGQDFSGSDIWGDDYALIALVANPGDSLTTPCIGRSMLWTPDSPDIMTVEEYREEQIRSNVFRCRHSIDEIIFDANFGHLLKVDA